MRSLKNHAGYTPHCVGVILLVLAFSGTALCGQAMDFYVNDSFTNGDVYCTAPGHNANDGLSPSTPKADIQAVMECYDVQPDDTIWVDTGRYVLCDSIVIHRNGNDLTASSFSTNAWLRAQTFDEGGIAAGTQTLSWAAGGPAISGTVRLDYSANAGVTWTPIASSVPAASGAYMWDSTTAVDSTQALWRVVLEQDVNVWDVNDQVFTISNGSAPSTNPTLECLTFNAGGIASGTQILRWAASGSAVSGTVSVDYTPDAGATWLGLASTVPASAQMYIWNTTQLPNTTQALWRVVLESNTNVLDVNDQVFTIGNGSPPSTNPTLECLTFNAGGIASGTQTLNWVAGGSAASGTVRLDFSADAGVTWSVMAINEPASVGRWFWYTTPFPSTTQALWRVVLESNTNVWDVNDQVFELNNGSPHTATDYYVNDAFTNGDIYCVALGHDANDGTSPSSPKASLQAILDNHDIEPGDTIWVDTGDYKLSRTITISALDAGMAGYPVVIRGSSNEVAGGSVFRFAPSTSEVTVLQGITNGEFETGYPGLVVPYEPGTNGWKSYSAPGARGMWDRSSTFSNELSMKLTVDEGGGSYTLISQDVFIHNTNHVSGSVSFEGWFRGDLSRIGLYGERAGAFLKLEFLDESLQHIGSPVENEWSNGRPLYGINTGGNWVRTSIECTNIPQAAAYIRFAIGLNTFGSQLPATGWWDNVSAVIELDGGTVICPTDGLLHIQDASWLTIENLRMLQGMEGIRISDAEGVLVRDCEIKENATGIKSSGSTVRIEQSRVVGGTDGARCSSGRMDINGCTFWGNGARQVWIEGGVGTVSNSIVDAALGGSVGVQIDGGATYHGDFNNLYAGSDAWVGRVFGTDIDTLDTWHAIVACEDSHSLSVDPRFVDPGAFDFHLKSRTGAWSVPLQAWVMHDADSPCIDTADPSAPYNLESASNGGHRNMGAYGNTPQASRSTDSDGDGLSDSLERYRIGSDPNNPDSDGDGVSDGDECLAGTSPTDDGSVFSFDGCSGDEGLLNGSELVLSWPSVEGRIYRIEWSTNLMSGFSILAEHLWATPPMNTYTHNVENVVGAFYRVQCEQP